MANYTTPGVYTEEISTLPPSVAEVSTAIPAFIGYTEKGPINAPTRISTLLDYENLFGGAPKATFDATVSETDATVAKTSTDTYLLYYSLSMYFKNGGGSCYIISIGDYTTALDTAAFSTGIQELEKEDEPTLVLIPDAVNLADASVYYVLCGEVLDHCGKMKDRFAILDVLNTDTDGAAFRTGVSSDSLAYGAAYFPFLETSLTYRYDEAEITIGGDAAVTLESIKTSNTANYNRIKTALSSQRMTLPPSGSIAGIYARVDRDRGVWKAPANVAVSGVISPSVKITNEQQGNLNVDPTAGKSINAIRSFTGRGTLVWGARTLAGNDNEWRYISVRRLFNLIEESTQKSTSFAVFEPNDATTWLKVKAMIESYLFNLWQAGALQGSAPEQAYFVSVGLGKTMTSQDVLEGRMIVEIGIAAVRPAEFIILRFTHKLAEA